MIVICMIRNIVGIITLIVALTVHSQIRIDTYSGSGSNNYSGSYIYGSICGESGNSSESESCSIRISTNGMISM